VLTFAFAHASQLYESLMLRTCRPSHFGQSLVPSIALRTVALRLKGIDGPKEVRVAYIESGVDISALIYREGE
jgi:hypothetical protein